MNSTDVPPTIKRRTKAAGLPANISCHTFRATGITAYLENGGTIENAQAIAAHESPRTTKLYDRTGDENTLDDQILPIARKTMKFAIWSIGIVVALNNAGYDVGAVLAGLGIGGLALAMAARDTVSNVFGGFTIFADRPFAIHDRIKVNSFDGVVEEIGLRSTRVRTLAGTMVTIPNATFSGTAVENISAEPSRKVVLKLGLTYDTPAQGMRQGLDILRRIVAGNGHLEDKVLAAFTEFGDFSMNLLFIYYIKKDADILDSQTEVNIEILKRFGEAGLDFAFPTQTLYTIPQASQQG